MSHQAIQNGSSAERYVLDHTQGPDSIPESANAFFHQSLEPGEDFSVPFTYLLILPSSLWPIYLDDLAMTLHPHDISTQEMVGEFVCLE